MMISLSDTKSYEVKNKMIFYKVKFQNKLRIEY